MKKLFIIIILFIITITAVVSILNDKVAFALIVFIIGLAVLTLFGYAHYWEERYKQLHKVN